MTKHKSYYDAYIEYCNALEVAAQEKLGRELIQNERKGIWNAGSIMSAETLTYPINLSTIPEELSVRLLEAKNAFESVVLDSKQHLIKELETYLKRDLLEIELSQIDRIEWVQEMMFYFERLRQKPEKKTAQKILQDIMVKP